MDLKSEECRGRADPSIGRKVTRELFRPSERSSTFFGFVTEQAPDRRGAGLKEQEPGSGFNGKGPPFDGSADADSRSSHSRRCNPISC